MIEMIEAYLVVVNKHNAVMDSILIYSENGSSVSGRAEKIFFEQCLKVEPKFAILDGDDLEDILSDGYYEANGTTVCLHSIVNFVKVNK